jgi:hypothetical protein
VKVGPRQQLLRESLPDQLYEIRSLQNRWPTEVRTGATQPEAIRRAIKEAAELRIDETSAKTLTSPLRQRQLGTASILLGISSLALVVVFFLVTGQLRVRGPITLLGMSLGAFLVAVPLIIGLHLSLGRLRVRIENGWLYVEHRQGIFGTKNSEILLSDVNGVWLIEKGDAGIHELLMLEKEAFFSLPVAKSAWPNWQAVFHQSH